MNPYPWAKLGRFPIRSRVARWVGWVGLVCAAFASVFSVVGGLVWLVVVVAQTRVNDWWLKRGLIVSVAGVGLIWVSGFTLPGWFQVWVDAFGSVGGSGGAGWAGWVSLGLYGLGPSLVFAGVGGAATSWRRWVASQGYLRPMRRTLRLVVRGWWNGRRLRRGFIHPGWVRFGLIHSDVLPWRSPRMGMIVERPLREFGHGLVVGANGSGKTVAALSAVYHAVANGASVLYLDCKDSSTTQESLRGIAQSLGVSFRGFTMSGERLGGWYHPLGWGHTPVERAAMVVGALPLPSEGDGAYYTGQIHAWLILQFRAMDAIVLAEGESQFDFLLATADPARYLTRIDGLSVTQPSLYQELCAGVGGVKASDLAGLRAHLTALVNAAGDRLRPTTPEDAIVLEALNDEPLILYVGLSATTDPTALKLLGALTLNSLGQVVGARFKTTDDSRPIVVITDEASRLEERLPVLNTLYNQAREAGVWLWTVTQTLAGWPQETVSAITTNAGMFITCRVPDGATADTLVGALGTRWVTTDYTQQVTTHGLQGSHVATEPESRTTVQRVPFLQPGDLTETRNYLAWVWFAGDRRLTGRRWRGNRLPRREHRVPDAPLVTLIPPDVVLTPPVAETPQSGVLVAPSELPTGVLDHGGGGDPIGGAGEPDPAVAAGWVDDGPATPEHPSVDTRVSSWTE